MEKLLKINKNLRFDYCDLMKTVDPNHKFTLRDVLRACIQSKIPTTILEDILQCDYIVDYWKEATSKRFRNDGEMEYLELAWLSEIDEFDGEENSGHHWCFHGIGKEGHIPDQEHLTKTEIKKLKKEKYRQGYAIEFSRMYKLAGYPIKIKNKISVEDWRGIDNVPQSHKKDFYDNMTTELDVQPSITLIELLYSIFWELSFCGSPEQRDDKCENISKTVDDFKKAKQDGTLKVVDFDEL